MCRSAIRGSSPILRSIGCSRASPSPSSKAAACTSRAARCWAAPARSTAWSICAATRPITISGGSAAAPAGIGTACCPISRKPRTRSAARAQHTAPAGRCASWTSRSAGNWPMPLLPRGSRPGCRATTISTMASRKAPAPSRARPTASGVGARRAPICTRRGGVLTWRSGPTRMRRGSSSKTAGRAASSSYATASRMSQRRAARSSSVAASTARRNCCNYRGLARRNI